MQKTKQTNKKKKRGLGEQTGPLEMSFLPTSSLTGKEIDLKEGGLLWSLS